MKINIDRLKAEYCDESAAKPLWDMMFDYSHGNFILAHGDKGTGKSFTLTQFKYIASQFGIHNFSNILFMERVSDADPKSPEAWEEKYPEDVDFTQSFAEMLGSWGSVKRKERDKKSLLVVDEFEIFVMYAMSKASKLSQIFLQQCRKLDMCILGMVHDWSDLPKDIVKWAKFLILKERHLAKEYLGKYGITFDYDHDQFDNALEAAEKKLAFILPKHKKEKFLIGGEEVHYKSLSLGDVSLEDIAEVILIEQDGSPWTKDPENTERGDIIYESKSPANFDVGSVGGFEAKDWWPVFKKDVWPSLSVELPQKCNHFFSNPGEYLGKEKDISDYDAIEKVQQMIRENSDMKDRHDNPTIKHDGKRISFSPYLWAKATGKERRSIHEVVK